MSRTPDHIKAMMTDAKTLIDKETLTPFERMDADVLAWGMSNTIIDHGYWDGASARQRERFRILTEALVSLVSESCG